MLKPPKHILVIRLSAMGDVAMTIPVLKAFTEQHPDVKLTVLTREFFIPFFRDLKKVELFTADVKGKHRGVLGLYKLSRELKALQIDAVADLHNVLRTKILKTFLPVRPFVQIDKGRAEKKALTSGAVFIQLRTTHQRYVDVFEALGFKIDLSNPTFPERSTLSSKLSQIVTTSNKLIGIAPFATYESKMYPINLMEEVIQELSKEHKILLFGGGKNEIEVLENIAAKNENVINLAGQLSLDEELDVISNLDIMLSMDSGNAHIAAMLGVKVVTIWGVTHPYAGFIPFNQPEEYQLLANRNKFPLIPTSIYGNKYPKGYEEASGSISINEIVEKVKLIV